MEIYNHFAYIYDVLMDDVDYSGWVDYIERILKIYGVKPARIVDLACGTGNITIMLKARGYDVIELINPRTCCRLLKTRQKKALWIFPLYARI